MDNELNINQALELLRRVRLIENTLNRLCDEIHDLEEARETLSSLNAELVATKYILDCEQSTYNRLTQELTEFANNCKQHTLKPSVIIERLGKKMALVEQQKDAKEELKKAEQKYDDLATSIKRINDTYGDISASIDEKKSEYCDVVASYNAHIATFIPYTDYTPTLIDPSVIRRIPPFPQPEELSDESDFE